MDANTVELAARAAHEAAMGLRSDPRMPFEPWESLPERWRLIYRTQARAALEAVMTPSEDAGALRVRLHNGEGLTLAHLALTPDNNGTAVSDLLPHGHIFIEIDGEGFGSLLVERNPAGPSVELGQYSPIFDQWAPTNPLTAPEPTDQEETSL